MGGWLLSHGAGERAGQKVLREVRVWAQSLPMRTLASFSALLRLLAAAVALLLCLGLGAALGVVVLV